MLWRLILIHGLYNENLFPRKIDLNRPTWRNAGRKEWKLSIDRAIEKSYWSESMIKYFPFFAVFLLPSWSSSFLTWLSKLLVELVQPLVCGKFVANHNWTSCVFCIKIHLTVLIEIMPKYRTTFLWQDFHWKCGLKYYNN